MLHSELKGRLLQACFIILVLTPVHTWVAQDAERMAGVLEDAGYSCASEAGDADVIVYNTCSIRDKAEQKVYSALGKQARAWRPLPLTYEQLRRSLVSVLLIRGEAPTRAVLCDEG